MAVKKSTSTGKKKEAEKQRAKAGTGKPKAKSTKATAAISATPAPTSSPVSRRLPSIRLPALEMPEPVKLPVRERVTRATPQEPVSVRPTVVQVPTKSDAELHAKNQALEKTVVRLTKQYEEARAECERHQAVIKQLRLELRVLTKLKKSPARK